MSINSVTLVGRTTRDPKIVENKNGGKTVLFTVAVERNYKDANDKRPTDFVAVKAFIQDKAKSNGPYDYLKKGQLIGVEAEVRTSQYEKDGETVYSQDIVVKQNGLSLLDRPKGSASAKEEVAEAPAEDAVLEISEDDLPF